LEVCGNKKRLQGSGANPEAEALDWCVVGKG
jgi:hypothetical protein